MIRNVVFDFGQVLVHFNPAYMIKQYISDEQDIALLENVLFDRLYWDKLDAGTITDGETLAAVRERIPERLWDVSRTIYENWIYMLPEIDGMRALLTDLKAAGIPMALLSNISFYFAAHHHEIPILDFFDVCVFSAVCGMTKPHKEIFDHVCNYCDFTPQETLFIDDSPKNIQGAVNASLQAYLFDGNADTLRAFLIQNGILSA